MTETRAVAHLPSLDIEIRHRSAPEEGTEYLAVTLRGTPNLDVAVGLLDPFRFVATMASLNPWLAWLQVAGPFRLWRPLLEARDRRA
ncbi:MAG: hypothetical protein AB7I59_14465 [Geminicoccaceae bacterium]